MGIDRNNYQIGIYLEKALKYKNLTTTDLSKLTGINASMLRKYLINEASPSLTRIKVIANALDMDVEYFTDDSYFKNGDTTKTILDNGSILHFEELNDKNLRCSFKDMSRMLNQIFNQVSLSEKKEIIDSMYFYLTTDIYKIISNEKNQHKDI